MSGSGDLQFEHVERPDDKSPATACASCQQPIRGVYYEVNGQVLCERCRASVEEQWNAGGAAGRFGKAVVLGVVAAAAGTALYYGVLALTGYEFGLIAIVVGFLVGAAVRKGSNGRGGWRYQALAIFLTYTSIVSSYVPLVIAEIDKQDIAAMDAKLPAAADLADTATASVLADDSVTAPVADDAAIASDEVSDLHPALLVLLGIGLIYALPFLAGLENILGLVIIAIGLYQAWAMNKRAELKIAGPFKVGAAT